MVCREEIGTVVMWKGRKRRGKDKRREKWSKRGLFKLKLQ
jgi:hypothetical protein